MNSFYTTLSDLGSSIVNAGTYLWGAATQPTPISLEQEIKMIFNSYAQEEITDDQCMEDCSQCLIRNLTESDCDLSIASQEKLTSLLESFYAYLDQNFHLDLSTPDDGIKALVKERFLQGVEKKWASGIAKEFYHILKISDVEQKAAEASKWTLKFYKDGEYFTPMSNLINFHGKPPRLISVVEHSYSDYYHAIHQKNAESMILQCEKNPTYYQNIGAALEEKEKLERSGETVVYTEQEKQLHDIANYAAQSILLYFPDRDNELILLRSCIVKEGFFRKLHGSPELRPRIFLEIFNPSAFEELNFADYGSKQNQESK